MNKLVLQPNEEIRVELIRLYLNQEHPSILRQLQEEVRDVTNHIVRGRKDTKNACVAYALKNGLVGPAPSFPEEPKLPKPTSKEENREVKEAWDKFYSEQTKARTVYTKWLNGVFKAVKGIPECEWRKDDYKSLRSIYGRVGSAVLYRDTVKRVNATKRAKSKRSYQDSPLVFGNSPIVETGSFYGNRRGVPFYNALVKAPGLPPIQGRLRRPLPGKPIQGVTLTLKADGWYAAVKCIVQKRQLPEPVMSPIGLDVGQTDLVALSDGFTERNIRDSEFVSLKAAIQEKGDRSEDANVQQECRNQVARLDQNRKRRITHWINSVLLPRLQRHSVVFVEKLAKNFKSDRGPLSCMHNILDAIKARLGDRVREVECAYTSQECSHCGNVSKIARKGKVYACVHEVCGVTLDADINAARNILRRGLTSLAIS
jgi:putative transposase